MPLMESMAATALGIRMGLRESAGPGKRKGGGENPAAQSIGHSWCRLIRSEQTYRP